MFNPAHRVHLQFEDFSFAVLPALQNVDELCPQSSKREAIEILGAEAKAKGALRTADPW